MSYNNVIRSDDINAFEKLNENYNHIKSRQDYMKRVNEYFSENGTVTGCPGVEEETAILLNSRLSEGQAEPYPKSFFTENEKTMDSLQKMMSRVLEKPETLFRGWRFAGGETVINLANNRLQLVFNDLDDTGELRDDAIYEHITLEADSFFSYMGDYMIDDKKHYHVKETITADIIKHIYE